MEETENQRLKYFRSLKKCTQQQFADLAGIKQGSYADQERGKVKVSGDVKLALFKEYSLNISWLETGKGEMFVPNHEEIIAELKNRISELESNGVGVAADGRLSYEPSINWQMKFVEVDDKYKALLENRLLEFLIHERKAGSSA